VLVSPVRIAFVHFPGRVARLEAARAGDAPSEFLFGAVELERRGHETFHYEVDPARPVSRVASLIDRGAGLGYLPPHASGAVLAGTRALLPQLRTVDVVVATTTATSVALAMWHRMGLLKRPLVGIVAGLVNHEWRRSRRWTTTMLLLRQQSVLYGEGELAELLGRAPRLAGRVHVDCFGVDTAFWTPAEVERAVDVVAIGNDGHRDWATLLAAAPHTPAHIRILTRHPRPDSLPPNVSWEKADWHGQVLSDDEVRELYRHAAVVVVPVRDVPQPSGQSVTLQAMACARPVVLSRTRGLWAPATLHDGDDVVFVPPGEPQTLAEAITELLVDPERAARIGAAARRNVESNAAVEEYASRLERVCKIAIDGG
jgi:hypothetical protein